MKLRWEPVVGHLIAYSLVGSSLVLAVLLAPFLLVCVPFAALGWVVCKITGFDMMETKE